ncbi:MULTISPECIES: hypothetical protein [unclassified Paraburkholderia]|uniref:hypothetical protein n=1 Tax=unclassified Paraburkholderia TaxID=2615204 RepID=UPI0015E69459|nr:MULTISPECIES: hypothetical protein [unclassified Paraburkholderia]
MKRLAARLDGNSAVPYLGFNAARAKPVRSRLCCCPDDVEDIWRDVARSGELAHLQVIVRAETGWRAQCPGNRPLKRSNVDDVKTNDQFLDSANGPSTMS